MVIIDNLIGYTGGMDPSWGRYDISKHPIIEGPNKDNIYEYPFMDYSNEYIKLMDIGKNYIKLSISRNDTTRMPWHDIEVKVVGPVVLDFVKHFKERWDFAIKTNMKEEPFFINIKNCLDEN